MGVKGLKIHLKTDWENYYHLCKNNVSASPRSLWKDQTYIFEKNLAYYGCLQKSTLQLLDHNHMYQGTCKSSYNSVHNYHENSLKHHLRDYSSELLVCRNNIILVLVIYYQNNDWSLVNFAWLWQFIYAHTTVYLTIK